uniref:Phycoerythrin alpha-subunit 1 n=1 Tax=Proteomonas sulcata TaxID=77928 RepID=A0A067YS95_9CRYP|nr:phycoerythrin alpha-subunit 1 [Proteomonas sulcata]
MKSVLALAMVGSAAAYVPMAMNLDRRAVVQTGAATAAVTPFLQGKAASADMDKSAKAPIITIFDHRGCPRAPKEGNTKSGSQDDEMMVKVASATIKVSEDSAAAKLQEFIGFKEKGLDGPADGVYTRGR